MPENIDAQFHQYVINYALLLNFLERLFETSISFLFGRKYFASQLTFTFIDFLSAFHFFDYAAEATFHSYSSASLIVTKLRLS